MSGVVSAGIPAGLVANRWCTVGVAGTVSANQSPQERLPPTRAGSTWRQPGEPRRSGAQVFRIASEGLLRPRRRAPANETARKLPMAIAIGRYFSYLFVVLSHDVSSIRCGCSALVRPRVRGKRSGLWWMHVSCRL